LRIFKNKRFVKFAKKEGIADAILIEAVMEAEAGLIDADYGGGVIKQRIARRREGKSKGYRTIILYRNGARAFFVYGFAKSAQDTISKTDERAMKTLAKTMLSAPDQMLTALLQSGKLEELQP
jgi:hypothetical protein